MINFILRLLGLFDRNGLKHELKLLNEMQFKIAFMAIYDQAHFADEVCVENAKNEDFLRSQLGGIDPTDTSMFANMNATAVGNLAYIALNGCVPEIRDLCKTTLDNYRNYLSSLNQRK